MQSDDDLQTTLSKWPFIIGDVLLVAAALAIGMLGHWQLTNLQVASCVIAVALGAGLFVLPYIVEYQVRVREQAEDRSGDLRIMQRHLIATEEQIEVVGRRVKTLESDLAALADSKADTAAPIQELVAGKLEPLQQEQAQQSNELDALSQQVDALLHSLQPLTGQLEPLQNQHEAQSSQLDALTHQLESLAQSLKDQSDTESILALQKGLAALQLKVEAISIPLVELSQADETIELAKVDEVIAVEEPINKKVRTARQRRSSEPRLLKRAIEQKQDASSSAVSRIIESKSRRLDEGWDELSSIEEQVADGVLSVAVEHQDVAESEPELNEPNESGVLFDDAVVVTAKPRTRAKQNDTAVVASVFIGIGNKPYVRGRGPGLNWDSGVAMEFEEIGKWRWQASADLEGPIEIQIFRNDEDPDTTGKHTLESGERLHLSPVF